MNRKSILSSLIILVIIAFSCMPDYEAEQEKTIKRFIDRNADLDFIKTSTGLYYCITKEGIGSSPIDEDTVVIRYAVKFLQADIWNVSYIDNDEGITYVLGKEQLLDGVEEALKYMNVGSESVVIVPSHLGYGNYSTYYDPYTPLCFHLILDAINP